MKHFNVIALVALLGAALTSSAQTKDEVEVKILPAQEKGFVKVLFVTNHSSDVRVKFYNDKGLYTLDEIAKGTYRGGFLKKYDIRQVRAGESFWIDVSTKESVTTYHMSELKDHTGYEPRMERRVPKNKAMLVAAKE